MVDRPAAIDLRAAYGFDAGRLAEAMDIRFHELTSTRAVATMPVDGNTQPLGLLHGGAHAVLAETLGSFAATLHAGPGRVALGIEINASHSRSVAAGFVTGTCEAIALGSTLTVHEVVVTDEEGHRLSTLRITNLLRTRPVAG